MIDSERTLGTLRRRLVSITGLLSGTATLTAVIPIWLPIVLLVDAVRVKWRFPLARLLAFAVCWGWIEIAGVIRATGLWVRRRSGDHAAHYALMGWWAGALMSALRATTGMQPRIEGGGDVADGNAVVLARHASLGDSLLSGWALATELKVSPRYVLKKELLFDPCLDIVGHRVPNHFLDREATDGSVELEALRTMASGIGPGSVAVIFAEGTRSNPAKRARALEKIAEGDPERAQRLGGLRWLLPPRSAGSGALLDGAPDADVVFAWHVGFDGLDSFRGMIRHVAAPPAPIRLVMRRVARSDVPDVDAFAPWLDEQWLQMDREVAAALQVS